MTKKPTRRKAIKRPITLDEYSNLLGGRVRQFFADATQPAPAPIRAEILKTASDITCGDRNKSYGDPYFQLGLAGRLIRALHEANEEHGLRYIGDAEWNAIESVALKLSRTCMGAYSKDNYIDGVNYFAIAGECAERAGNGEVPKE